MYTIPENTLAGLKEYFFDSVFSANCSDYPADMPRDVFGARLDNCRDILNLSGCRFPAPAYRTISQWHNEYLREIASNPQ